MDFMDMIKEKRCPECGTALVQLDKYNYKFGCKCFPERLLVSIG
jgi:ssDNA-binding Zn-finger/Zn-ribbon topoisomerase 1